jgi:hypothetical protein
MREVTNSKTKFISECMPRHAMDGMGTKGTQLLFSEATKNAGHQLLDHQCWVLGRDVLSVEGNLLCEFGFYQVRCPNGGMTQYELKNGLGVNTHVYLWGFGAFFGDEKEGVFLGRRDFRPSRTSGRVELHSRDYPDFREAASRLDLLMRGFAWFAEYEQWIAQRMPTGYRDSCLETFPRKTLCGAEFTQRWIELANRIVAELL